jgi:Lon protease-like protein
MRLPLFPLNTVLFPGCVLDLQIFEPRYLDMVSACLKRGEGFGVVGLFAGREVGEAAREFALVGCEALIRDWQQRPNGLLGIRVEGGRRFRIARAEVQRDQLTVADVDWLEPGVDAPLGDEHADLLALLTALLEHPVAAGLGMEAPVESQQVLANRLAYLLPFSLAQKLESLMLEDPAQRLRHIQTLLEQLQGEALA